MWMIIIGAVAMVAGGIIWKVSEKNQLTGMSMVLAGFLVLFIGIFG
ncbi:MAG: hypothetical protein IJ561_03865 [Ruminococcus sp.]|nr:hypothetical protein [Ruminococcus sp.]